MSDLFGGKPPRKRRRYLMHVVDATDQLEYFPELKKEGANHVVQFQCFRCQYETDWVGVKTITEGRRGIPCPNCNKEK